MHLQAKECQRLPGTTRSEKEARQDSPLEPSGEHGPSSTLILTSSPQSSENINFCFKPLSLWIFVTSAPGNIYIWSWDAVSGNQHSTQRESQSPGQTTRDTHQQPQMSGRAKPGPAAGRRSGGTGPSEEVTLEADPGGFDMICLTNPFYNS